MKIEGLSPGKAPGTGTLVVVTSNIVWSINSGKHAVGEALANLEKEGIIEGPLKVRSLNTKVLGFVWRRPSSAGDVAAQRAAIETNGKGLFKEVHAFDIDGLTPVDTNGEGKSHYLDGGEIVVQVAKKHPHRIDEVLSFVREPQRPDWVFDDLFAAAGEHNAPEKRLKIYEAILSFPAPSASNRYRPTYLAALNNTLVLANKLKDVKRARALADRARPFVKENPYLTHSAACAFVASGDLDLAAEMVGFAVKFKYEKLDALKSDDALAKLHKRPDWAALFEPTTAKTAPKKKKKAAARPEKKTASPARKKKAAKKR